MAGTEPRHMLAGIITFFICEIYALSVAVFGGSMLDILEGTFYNLGFFDYDKLGSWGSPESFVAYSGCVNLLYLSAFIIAGLGVVILILTIWHRHGSDREELEPYNQNL